jgi:hypothetical protein
MSDELNDKAAKYAAAAIKRKATWAAKKAAEAKPAEPNVQRLHKDEPEPASHEGEQVAAAREGSRLNPRSGRVEAYGRDGELLSRTQHFVSDEFEIPKHKWPKDWSYQWNTISIHGNTEITNNMMHLMQAQGWRPVPAERHAGDILPKGARGSIIRGGMILEERPESLTLEARAEDLANARKLVSDRNESLKLTKMNMPDGFKNRNDVSGVRIQIDKSLDVANVNQQAGNYTLEK